jgi:hypothetical protein
MSLGGTYGHLHHGTIFDACAAPGAPVFDNTARSFSNFHLEIARFAGNAFKICIGN